MNCVYRKNLLQPAQSGNRCFQVFSQKLEIQSYIYRISDDTGADAVHPVHRMKIFHGDVQVQQLWEKEKPTKREQIKHFCFFPALNRLFCKYVVRC